MRNIFDIIIFERFFLTIKKPYDLFLRTDLNVLRSS